MTRTVILLLAAASASGGCAALTNPVADAVPMTHLPPEVIGRPKADLRPLPLTLLRQRPPADYPLDSGDVLAVVASEVIAPGDQAPPVQLPDQPGRPAVVGYPVPVRDDGTISIPLLAPIPVRGKTVREVERILLETVTGKRGGRELVKPEAARVSVQLLQRRQYQVLVVRGDTPSGNGVGPSGFGGGGVGGGLGLGGLIPGAGFAAGGGATGKQGMGFNVSLPAYENDVFRALNATGGLPGADAKNEVLVIRGGAGYCDAADQASRTIRIPLQAYPDQPITIREEDVILHDGDVVMIESRQREVFYTGGILGSGIFPLPRDIDLDVIQAICLVRGPLVNGSFSQSALNGSSVSSGLGNPNATLVSVLRQLPDQRQIEIRVDVAKALREPKERLRLQPGDIVVMQETPKQAMVRYITNQLRISTTFDVIKSASINSVGTIINP